MMDKLTRIVWKDGRIAGLEIKGSRIGRSDEDRCPRVAFLKIQPLRGLRDTGLANSRARSLGTTETSSANITHIWMPVKLPQSPGFQLHHGRSDGGGDWENMRVDDRERPPSPRNGRRSEFGEPVDEFGLSGGIRDIGGADGGRR